MKTILVPTDFSGFANDALNCAVEISKKNGASIILVHAYDFLDYYFHDKASVLVQEYNEEVRNELINKLNAIRKSIQTTENIDIQTFLIDGNVIESIIKAAEAHRADLIIMGTLGDTGLKDKIIGNRSGTVLRKSTVPVLVVPPGYQWAGLDKIVIAVKGNEKPELFEMLLDFIKPFGSGVNLVVFSDENEEAYEVLDDSRNIHKLHEQLLEKHGGTIDVIHLSGESFVSTVNDFCRDKNVSLLVMITRHKKWMDKFFGISQTQKMIAHPVVPVLAIDEN